jgi:hypothetical protein
MRAVARADFIIPNDLEEAAMKSTLKRLNVEPLKGSLCHVERSETSLITILAHCRNNQRFFAPLRMTVMFTAALTL